MKWTPSALAIAGSLALFAGQAGADDFAYEVTGWSTQLFGIIDLNTGVFTSRGYMGQTLAGLGSYGGVLYGGAYGSNTLYSINTTTGALTAIGDAPASVAYGDFGSTTSGLYGFGTNGYLYSINPTTGTATAIGATGLSFGGIVMGMSSGSNTLYLTQNDFLYALNTTNGAATLIGTANVNEFGFGALVNIGSTLYAGAAGPSNTPNIYTLDPQNADATFVTSSPSTPSAPDVAGFWGLAPAAVPGPIAGAGLPGLIAVFGGFLALGRRRRRPADPVRLESAYPL
jgi:hypothetical protein